MKIGLTKISLIALFFIGTKVVYGQNSSSIEASIQTGFIENVGQIKDQNQKVNSHVEFLLPTNKGLNVQLNQTGFSYDYYVSDSKSKTVNFQRIEIHFENSNERVRVLKEKPIETLLQYIGTDQKTYTPKQFEQIVYQNMYPNIDIVYSMNTLNGQFKYDFIVHPGGKISDIKMRFSGMESAKVEQGSIYLTHPLGVLTETIPGSWYQETKEKVNISYQEVINNGTELILGFKADKAPYYNKTLVIDPEPKLDWASYFGMAYNTKTTGVTTTNNGYVFISGTTQSLFDIATYGPYQSQMNDSLADAFLMRFSPSGACLWATYFGGNNYDEGNDVAVDTLGHVFLFGTTFSDSLIASDSSFQNNMGGGSDLFLAKFLIDGTFLWSTYIGGPGMEAAGKISTDFKGNAFIIGTSENSSNSLTTTGVHQINNNGFKDVLITKIDSLGSIAWSTYFGGEANDIGTCISAGDSALFIGGYTQSNQFISSDLAHQTTLYAQQDGFIAKLDDSLGILIWSTYFGGDNDDFIYGLKAYNKDVYFTGSTLSDTNILFNHTYQTERKGLEDAFIGKIDSDSASIIWSTYYGGEGADYGIDLDIEMDGDVVFCGTTSSDSLISFNDVHQVSRGGDKDAFLVKTSNTGDFIWGSYYGGYLDENAFSVDVYGNTLIYLVGSTRSDSAITTSTSSYQDTLSGLSNGFLACFRLNKTTPPNGICGTSSTLNFCVGDTVELSIVGGALGADAEWAWYAGDCGNDAPMLGTGESISFIASSSFIVYVRAETVTNAEECFSESIYVHELPIPVITAESSFCRGDSVTLISNGSVFDQIDWVGPNGYSNSGTSIQVLVSGDSVETYTIHITDPYFCQGDTSLTLIVQEKPIINLIASSPNCFNTVDGEVHFSYADSLNYLSSFNGLISSNFDFLGLDSGAHFFQIISMNGCVSDTTIIFNTLPRPIQDTTVISTMCKINSGMTNVSIHSFYEDYTVVWQPSGSTGPTAENLPYGEQTAVVSTNSGCTDTIVLFVPYTNNFYMDESIPTHESCVGLNDGSIQVFAHEGIQPYAYSLNTVAINLNELNNLSAGTYYVSVSDSAGCELSDTVIILPAIPTTWEDSLTTAHCGLPTGAILLYDFNGLSPFTFLWSNAETTHAISNVYAGTYSVTVYDSNLCETTMSYTIDELNDLLVQATPNSQTISIGETLLLSSEAMTALSTEIIWTPTDFMDCSTCANPSVRPLENTTYTVLYTTSNGCFGSDTVEIIVDGACDTYFIPTDFSPNGDGLNDNWNVMSECIVEMEMRVFNQWSELIFTSTNTSNQWDGTYQGALVQNDSYSYVLTVSFTNGFSTVINGQVQVNH
jgi:gliding motility-associated-like protein